jgi:hypothetical protein
MVIESRKFSVSIARLTACWAGHLVAVNEKRRLIFLFSLKIIAAIEEPAVIERILTHLGLSAQPPPRTPARRVDIFQAA